MQKQLFIIINKKHHILLKCVCYTPTPDAQLELIISGKKCRLMSCDNSLHILPSCNCYESVIRFLAYSAIYGEYAVDVPSTTWQSKNLSNKCLYCHQVLGLQCNIWHYAVDAPSTAQGWRFLFFCFFLNQKDPILFDLNQTFLM